jgi:hypothetical protein
VLLDHDADAPTRRGELRRVDEQVEQHLAQLLPIRQEVDGALAAILGQVPLDDVLLGGQLRLHEGEDVIDDVAREHGSEIVLEPPGHRARVVQHVVDEAEEVPLRALHPLERLALGGRHGAVDLVGEQRDVALDGVERGAQLVAHRRQELALRLVRRLRGGAPFGEQVAGRLQLAVRRGQVGGLLLHLLRGQLQVGRLLLQLLVGHLQLGRLLLQLLVAQLELDRLLLELPTRQLDLGAHALRGIARRPQAAEQHADEPAHEDHHHERDGVARCGEPQRAARRDDDGVDPEHREHARQHAHRAARVPRRHGDGAEGEDEERALDEGREERRADHRERGQREGDRDAPNERVREAPGDARRRKDRRVRHGQRSCRGAGAGRERTVARHARPSGGRPERATRAATSERADMRRGQDMHATRMREPGRRHRGAAVTAGSRRSSRGAGW